MHRGVQGRRGCREQSSSADWTQTPVQMVMLYTQEMTGVLYSQTVKINDSLRDATAAWIFPQTTVCTSIQGLLHPKLCVCPCTDVNTGMCGKIPTDALSGCY